MASNPPQVTAIHIHFGCAFSQAFWIAVMFRGWRVLPLTVHTPIPLRTRIGFTRFVLSGRCLAFWTFLHSSILAHYVRHSLAGRNSPSPRPYPPPSANETGATRYFGRGREII